MEQQPRSSNVPGKPEKTVGYGDVHAMLGVQRAPLWDLMDTYRAGGSVDGHSLKERVGALEAIIFDDVWIRYIQTQRKANPEAHGLSMVLIDGAPEGVQELPDLFFNHQDEHHPYPANCRILQDPLPADFFQGLGELFREGEPEHQSRAIDGVINCQNNSMLVALLAWESEMTNALIAGEVSPIIDHYRQFIELLYQYKPHLCLPGLGFPAFRTMAKGLLFGSPFQWRVIKRFPIMAERDLQMPWGEEVFNGLMDGLEPLTEKLAQIHGNALILQAEVLEQKRPRVKAKDEDPRTLIADLSAHIQCRRNHGRIELHVDPALIKSLKNLVADPAVAGFAKVLDSGPITGCPAFYSEIFTGTRQWNRAIARDIMLPPQTAHRGTL